MAGDAFQSENAWLKLKPVVLLRSSLEAYSGTMTKGAGVAARVKASRAKMPFPAEAPTTIPLSWKQKQRACVNAGLRCMNAPMARVAKNLGGGGGGGG